MAGAGVNGDRVASYQDWRDDLLRGVGPVIGLPYALADLLTAAWINPETYSVARGSIDMSPWGFPTDRDGTVSAIRERAALLGDVWTAQATKIPQNVPDREGRHVIPVRWWNIDGYRLVPGQHSGKFTGKFRRNPRRSCRHGRRLWPHPGEGGAHRAEGVPEVRELAQREVISPL